MHAPFLGLGRAILPGALFCDGQYIAVQDIPGCIDYLIDNLDVSVEAEASATISCSSAGARGGAAGLGAFALFGLGLCFVRRRRRA